jgi:hypothetical protein
LKLFYYIHKRLYGYPSRGHVRLALQQDLANNSFKWRIGMLYVCGESLEEIAKHFSVPRERVRMTLNILVLGVK